MGIIDDIKSISPEANSQNTWVKELIDKRYQPQNPRIKRQPQGFNFTREAFDPSSYYNQIGSYRDISRAATEVVKQEAFNKEAAQQKAAAEANQKAMEKALKQVSGKITYSMKDPTGGLALSGLVGGKQRNYGLKGISKNTSSAANYFGSRYGIKSIGGLGPGSVPGSDHPHGRALDFMINNIRNGTATGTALANEAIRNYKQWNIKYVIWNRYIWKPGSGWHKYSGPSPHTDHVHVSFNK